MVKKGVTTYFLAQKSGLFRPGAATILANAPMKNTVKPKLGLRKEGQKPGHQGGGQSGGNTHNLAWILALGYWNDNGVWVDNNVWID